MLLRVTVRPAKAGRSERARTAFVRRCAAFLAPKAVDRGREHTRAVREKLAPGGLTRSRPARIEAMTGCPARAPKSRWVAPPLTAVALLVASPAASGQAGDLA